MKIIVEIPDIIPADFTNPSPELQRFVSELKDLCLSLSKKFRRADGRELFSAFVRNGPSTVFCTDSLATKQIHFLQKSEPEEIEEEDVGVEEEFGEEREQAVVMDEDLPGKWIVARLCIEGWPGSFLNLYSTDFRSKKGKKPKAKMLLDKVVLYLARQAHVVPGPDS